MIVCDVVVVVVIVVVVVVVLMYVVVEVVVFVVLLVCRVPKSTDPLSIQYRSGESYPMSSRRDQWDQKQSSNRHQRLVRVSFETVVIVVVALMRCCRGPCSSRTFFSVPVSLQKHG